MTETERRLISEYIEDEFGIRMPEQKRGLLEGRLAKRLRALGYERYGEYFEFVTRSPDGADEFLHFADLVSTHETSFFREPSHFEFLTTQVVPLWNSRFRERPLRFLSSACSTGEEAYSIGIAIEEGLDSLGITEADYQIEGIDLSEHACQAARRAVYLEAKIHHLSVARKQRFFLRSKDAKEGLCRVVPELRGRAHFHTGNLLGHLNLLSKQYDVIFCRNVLIYFSAANQKRLVNHLLDLLVPGGFLFLGHSESLMGLNSSGRLLGDAIVRRE